MISAFIFAVHLVFALIIFTKKWQEENLTTGFLNLGLIGILFAVGWSISGMIAKVLMDQDGLGLYYNRDDFSLTILTIGEVFFYKLYYSDTFTAAGKEKQ